MAQSNVLKRYLDAGIAFTEMTQAKAEEQINLFLPQGNRAQLLEDLGLTAQQIARFATELVAAEEKPVQITTAG